MHRNATYRLVLALLFAGMLTVILHPIHATPVRRVHDRPADGEDLLRLASISQMPEWNQTYGGTSNDIAQSVVETGDGGYIIAGETLSFGAGEWDVYLVKTDASGNMEWNQTYGGTKYDYARSVVETSDGGYTVAGYTSSFGAGGWDFWLVKTDSSGNMEWSQTYGGTNIDVAHFMVETGDGGYAIAGETWSFDAGGWGDFWLVKTDSAGNALWNQSYGGTKNDYATSVVETDDGGYAVAGSTRSFGAGNVDFWLVKTDSVGNMEWSQTYGGTSYDYATSVVETDDGGYALAGYTSSFGAGDCDFWLVKTDAAGNALWRQTYGGTRTDVAQSVVETSDGGYALAGYTSSFGAGGSDCWLVKTDTEGNMEWNQTYGGTDSDKAPSVVETSDGGYALAGYTSSFGADGPDFWLVKLAGPAPPIVEATVDITPEAVNLKSNGKCVTCYLELPQDYNVENIDLDALRVNDAVGIAPAAPTEVGDYDADGVLDLMVKFDRHDVVALLSVGDATLTITGQVNGTPFEGSDIIRVIGE